MQGIFERILEEFNAPFENSVLIFSVILFIILFVPLFFNRFKIPGIVGLIISGTIIGPHGFNLIMKNSAVDLFSTIGLLYIMFIAGLELDLNEFRKQRNRSLIFGVLTFLVPITLGIPVCYYLLGYEMNTSILVASMFATHTLIAYPIVNRLGITKNQAVAVAVGGTILTDTAVLILLAVITGAGGNTPSPAFYSSLAVMLIVFTAITVFVIPRVSSWFFKRLEDEKYAHFIFVLSVVFFSAFLAELCGLEPIIGAFAAGLSLNRLIPHTSSLMNRITFVGNSLFIPFFLISVGMLIDVSVLANGSAALFVALTLTAVALASKWLAATITGTFFQYTKAETYLLFGLSSAHAAATLAVILVGYNIGLIDDNILNGTIILILITCVVASFVTERAGKRVLLQGDTEPEKKVGTQRILIPIANPGTMEKLIDFGIMIKDPKEPFPLVALSVVKDNDQAQEKLVQSKKLLDKAIIHAAAADQKVEITVTIDRNVTSGIKRIVKEKFITDLILGWSDEKNLADIIFGKTFDGLLKQTHQGVFITRFEIPLNVHRHIVLFCPEFAEKEPGFYKWITAVFRLSLQLSIRIDLYASAETAEQLKGFNALKRFNVPVQYKGPFQMTLLEDPALSDPGGLLIFVSSRSGCISYSSDLDFLPKRLGKKLNSNNIIFIYPEINASNPVLEFEQDIKSDAGRLVN